MTFKITLESPEGKRFDVISDYDSEGDAEFSWTEGNYACDCNRSLLTGNGDAPCGEKWKLIKIDPTTDENPDRNSVGPA